MIHYFCVFCSRWRSLLVLLCFTTSTLRGFPCATFASQAVPLVQPLQGRVVYTQIIDQEEHRQNRKDGYDIFMQPIPEGKPIPLTDHRREKILGGQIRDITLDYSGTYVAFKANRKDTLDSHNL